jgi:hypothetical protein
VTGRLADDVCLQLADFINTIGLTSSQWDTFFKLELVSELWSILSSTYYGIEQTFAMAK